MNRPLVLALVLLVLVAVAVAVGLSLRGPATLSHPEAGDAARATPEKPEAAGDTTPAAAPAEPAPDPRRLVGRVVTADGTPLACARVTATADRPEETGGGRPDMQPGRAVSTARLNRLRRGASWKATVVSGEDGRFSAPRGGPPPYRLTARLDGYGTKVLTGVAPEPGEEIRVVLERGATVRGVVLEAEKGEPISGAKVRAPGGEARTGRDGRFELDDLPSGDVELTFEAAAFRPEKRTFALVPGGVREGVSVALEPGPGILGTVLDPDGKPVAGATVTATSGSASEHAGTDDRGRFALGDPGPGSWRLTATAQDLAPAVREGVLLEEGQRLTGVELRLARGGAVAGKVFGPDGGPVAGARVAVVSPDRSDAPLSRAATRLTDRPVRTGADGAYRVAGIAAGEWRLEVEADGMKPSRSRLFPVAEGETARIDVTLETGVVVSGRVVNRKGEPIAGARVGKAAAGMMALMRGMGAGPSATSREDGTFVLAGLTGSSVDLTARCDGYAPVTKKGVRPGASGVDFVLGNLGSIAGRVLDAKTKAPLEAFEVEAMSASGGFMGAGAFLPSGEVEILGDGWFRVGGLEPGAYTLNVYPGDYAPARRAGVTVTEGEETGGVEILAERGSGLRGVVLAEDGGAPIAGAKVTADLSGNMILAMTGQGRSREAATDESGRFSLDGLPEGSTTVRVAHPSFAEHVLSNVRVPAEAELEIRLVAGGTVTARVLDRDGAPVAGTMVLLQRNVPWLQMMGTTDAEGRVTFESVPPGSFMVMKMDVGGTARGGLAGMDLDTKTVAVANGETAEVVIRDEGGAAVSGRVLRGGEPVAGAMVFLMGQGEGAQAVDGMKSAITGEDGAYDLEDVRPGDYNIAVSNPGGFTPGYSEKLSVVEGQDVRRDLDLPLAAAGGRVVDEEGKGLAGVQVVAVPPQLSRFRVGEVSEAMQAFGAIGTSGEDGVFRLEGLRPGEYVIRAWREGLASAYSEPFTVPELGAAPENVRVVLPAGLEVKVRVRAADGTPLPGAWIFATDSGGKTVTLSLQIAALTDTGGVAVLRLAPGEYRLEVQPTGHPAAFRTISVGRAGNLEFEVEVPPAGRLEVTVHGEGDAPVEGAKLEILDDAGRPVMRRATGNFVEDGGDRTVTDAEGRLDYPLLAPGTYRVKATAEDGRTATATARVRAGETTRRTLMLE